MKTPSQLAESIRRFQEGFWAKRSSERPCVGVVNEGVFLPINYIRRAFARAEVMPQDVGADLVMTDYEFGFAERAVSCDDFLPFSAPWRGVPWVEACCGCPVRYSPASLAPGHFVGSAADLAGVPIPAGNEWFECMKRQTALLAGSCPADCWISPSILRGPSDVIAAMRGLTEFYCDLHDHPDLIAQAAARVNRLLIQALDMHFGIVQPKLGGYGHIYGYWAPGKTLVIQEDVLGMCSPGTYRDIFMEHNARLVEHLGPHVLFHLHTTGCAHHKDVLAIPGIAGVEITVEANGPPLLEMVSVLREVLEKSRLILFVDHGFEQLTRVLRHLPRQGLYLVIPDRYIRSDDDFRHFTAAHW